MLGFFSNKQVDRRWFGLSININIIKKKLLTCSIEWVMTTPFKWHMWCRSTSKFCLQGWCWKRLAVIFLLEPRVCTMTGWLGSRELFFFSSLFSLFFPWWNIKVSFNLFFVFNLFLILLIVIFFLSILDWFLFFNFSSYHLVSFNFYIKFGPYSIWLLFVFLIPFVIEFCF